MCMENESTCLNKKNNRTHTFNGDLVIAFKDAW